jgi:hypothetical protein
MRTSEHRTTSLALLRLAASASFLPNFSLILFLLKSIGYQQAVPNVQMHPPRHPRSLLRSHQDKACFHCAGLRTISRAGSHQNILRVDAHDAARRLGDEVRLDPPGPGPPHVPQHAVLAHHVPEPAHTSVRPGIPHGRCTAARSPSLQRTQRAAALADRLAHVH